MKRIRGLAERDRSTVEPRQKLVSLREAVTHSFPTADIEVMNAEIEPGYRS
ncbi:MAG: hypothetical protein ACKV2U_15210 [Bryobacteraceae bacterium]